MFLKALFQSRASHVFDACYATPIGPSQSKDKTAQLHTEVTAIPIPSPPEVILRG